jgi:hypothetical protein
MHLTERDVGSPVLSLPSLTHFSIYIKYMNIFGNAVHIFCCTAPALWNSVQILIIKIQLNIANKFHRRFRSFVLNIKSKLLFLFERKISKFLLLIRYYASLKTCSWTKLNIGSTRKTRLVVRQTLRCVRAHLKKHKLSLTSVGDCTTR